MSEKPFLPFRDALGTFTAFAIVIAFISIGFVAYFTQTFLGLSGEFDKGWLAAMLSLASAAFGFLIGKRVNSFKTGFDRPLCKTCPIRDQIRLADNAE